MISFNGTRFQLLNILKERNVKKQCAIYITGFANPIISTDMMTTA